MAEPGNQEPLRFGALVLEPDMADRDAVARALEA